MHGWFVVHNSLPIAPIGLPRLSSCHNVAIGSVWRFAAPNHCGCHMASDSRQSFYRVVTAIAGDISGNPQLICRYITPQKPPDVSCHML
jgi:hypothetical protein